MLESSPIPSIPARPVKKTVLESNGIQEPIIPKRPSRVSTSESLAKAEPTIPARPKKGATDNDKQSTQSDVDTKKVEGVVELDKAEAPIPVVPSRRPIKSPIGLEVDEPSVLEEEPVQVAGQDLDEIKAELIEREQEVQSQEDESSAQIAGSDYVDVSARSPLSPIRELDSTNESTEDVSSDHVVLAPSIPSRRPTRSTLEEASDAKDTIDDGPSDNIGKSLTPSIPSHRPTRSTLEEASDAKDAVDYSTLDDTVDKSPTPSIPSRRPIRDTPEEREREETVPIVPLRPSSTSRTTSSTSIPTSKVLEENTLTDKLPTSSSVEIESKLNSEVEKASENDTEADGDKTPGNTDTKTTFKSFEEDRSVSDSSSFNDDVETVLQEKDELENTDDTTSQTFQKEEDSKEESEEALEVEGSKVGEETEPKSDSVLQNPTIPKRPLKPEQKERESSIGLENTPIVHKAPPPKPKKLSSKMAAFQEMFNQKPPVLARSNSGSVDTSATDSKETPSIPKRPSKLSSDKVKFGNNLNLTGMMGGRGIALPGMVDLSLLKKRTQDEEGEEDVEAENIEKTAAVPTSDVRKGRAKGPKGKRLPKSITDTTVESSSRFSIVVENLWEISHVKNAAVEDELENSAHPKSEDDDIDEKISGELDEGSGSIEGLKGSSKTTEDIVSKSKSTEFIDGDKEEHDVSRDKDVISDSTLEKANYEEEIDDTSSLSKEDKLEFFDSGNVPVSEDALNTETSENHDESSPAIATEKETNQSSDASDLQNKENSVDSEIIPVPEESKAAIFDLDSLISQAKEDVESFKEDNGENGEQKEGNIAL